MVIRIGYFDLKNSDYAIVIRICAKKYDILANIVFFFENSDIRIDGYELVASWPHA